MAGGSQAAGIPALEWTDVTKEFGHGPRQTRLRALTGLTLRVPPGRIFGLLGPNGGGKSTAIKLVLGLLAPTAGSCRILGRASDDPAARQAVGYLPEAPQFYPTLTGFELVEFAAELCGCARGDRAARVRSWLDRLGLATAANRRLGTYSRGMLQRVGLAQALVHDPRVLILDEPTSGVDPAGVDLVKDLLHELRREGRTILLTSHVVSDLADLCDEFAILAQGHLVASGAVASLGGGLGYTVESLTAATAESLQVWACAHGASVKSLSRAAQLERAYLPAVGRS